MCACYHIRHQLAMFSFVCKRCGERAGTKSRTRASSAFNMLSYHTLRIRMLPLSPTLTTIAEHSPTDAFHSSLRTIITQNRALEDVRACVRAYALLQKSVRMCALSRPVILILDNTLSARAKKKRWKRRKAKCTGAERPPYYSSSFGRV